MKENKERMRHRWHTQTTTALQEGNESQGRRRDCERVILIKLNVKPNSITFIIDINNLLHPY
jgi:hypothetical protein